MSNLDENGFVLGIGEVTQQICHSVQRKAQFKAPQNQESCLPVEAMSAIGFGRTLWIIFKGANHLADWYDKKKRGILVRL